MYLYAVSAVNDRYLEVCTVKDNEISILLKAAMLDSSDTVLELRLVGAGGEMLASPALTFLWGTRRMKLRDVSLPKMRIIRRSFVL